MLYQRHVPLAVYNSLPGSDIGLGTNDDNKDFLLGFWKSCAANNTVNILVHQMNITQHSHLVETYEFFYNHSAFEPIKLACAVDRDDLKKTESNFGKFTAVVTYRNYYIEGNGQNALLLIVIGNGVAVNTLLILLTFLVEIFS